MRETELYFFLPTINDMKKKLFSIIACVSVMTSCKNELKQTPEQLPNQVSTVQCYSYTTENDTISMKLTLADNEVTGNLTYKYFQKDQNKGTLRGAMTGDTLFATYTFTSEGIESSREVAFLKKGTDLVEGYGDSKEKNGMMIFTSKASLDFNSKTILKLVECGK